MLYQFENFDVDSTTFEVRKSGQVQNVEKQVFDLLLLLVTNPDRVVSKDEIIETVWGGRAISDAAINSRISTLRSVLNDSGREQRLIKTIHNKGLRFVGEVSTILPKSEPAQVTRPALSQKTPRRFSFRTFLGGAALGVIAAGSLLFLRPDVIIDTDKYSPWQQSLPTESYLARDAYLRGVSLRDKSNSLAKTMAADQFQIAIDNDPDFAPAYAALASIKAQMFKNDPKANKLLKDEISQLLAQAKALAPKSNEVRQAEGEIALLDHEFGTAMMLADKVIEDDKHYLPAYLLRSEALYELGRIDESIDVLGVAISMDPLSPEILEMIAKAKLANGDYQGSLEAADANIWWNPESVSSHISMARFTKNKAEYEKSFEFLNRAKSINSLNSNVRYDMIELYHDLRLLQDQPEIAQSDMQRALVHAKFGKKDQAMALLGNMEIKDVHLDIHYLLREFGGASQRYNVFLAGRSELKILPGQGLHYARMCYVFKRVKNPLEQSVCRNLDRYYKERNPDDFSLYSDILGGTAYALLRGEEDQALSWLGFLAENGHAFLNLTAEPVFAPLDEMSDFDDILQRMQANADLHTDFIQSKF